MNTLMIIEDESDMLQIADFPDFYVDKHHPEDFIPMNRNIKEFFFHRMPGHNRLILRISVRLGVKMFIPFSFICDTGAPSYLYINDITRRLIKDRIVEDELGNHFIYTHGKRLPVYPSPSNHSDTNIIGLMGLAFFKLFLEIDNFGFNDLPEYL